MKVENLIGFGLIAALVWQISKRDGGSGAPTIYNAAPPRGTRWEDALVQGIQTAGQVAEAAIRSQQQASAATAAGCRVQAQRQVREAQAAGVTIAGNDSWADVESRIYQACVAGIS